MIYIGFALRNPFKHRHEGVKSWTVAVTRNKTIEFGIYRNNSIIGGSFKITGLREDHAGFGFDLELLSWNLDFIFYDNRHFDDRPKD